MTRITGISVRQDGLEYSLSLLWDDEAFVEGAIKFDLETRIGDVDGDGSEIKGTASVLIETHDADEPHLVVMIGDKRAFDAPISSIIGETTVIDSIPRELFGLGDPVVGCLLRAGIAATVGQIIECKDKTAGHEWTLPRLKAIGRCLVESGAKLAGRALLRAGFCIVTG